MKAILLRNKIKPDERIRNLAGEPIRNSYEDFGRVLEHCDQFPVSRLVQWRKEKKQKQIFKILEGRDIILAELTFYITFAEVLDDYINHMNKKGGRGGQKIVVYTGAIDRWIRHLGANTWEKVEEVGKRKAIEAARKTVKRIFDVMGKADIIGAMNVGDIPFWKGLFPRAQVFWMPCIVPVGAYRKRMKPVGKRERRVNLCVHTDILLPAHARRGDLMSLVVFRNMTERVDGLKGLTFMQKSHRDALQATQTLVGKLGIRDVRVSPHIRDWAEMASRGYMGLNVMQSRVQGRWQTAHAAMGIPMVASREITAQAVLFPDLSVDWPDLLAAEDLGVRLFEDKGFYGRCSERALSKIDWFGPDTQRGRLLDILAGRGEEVAQADAEFLTGPPEKSIEVGRLEEEKEQSSVLVIRDAYPKEEREENETRSTTHTDNLSYAEIREIGKRYGINPVGKNRQALIDEIARKEAGKDGRSPAGAEGSQFPDDAD